MRPSVKADIQASDAAVCNFLQTWGVSDEEWELNRQHILKYLKYHYSLNCACAPLNETDAGEFLVCVRECSMVALWSAIKGLRNPARVSARQIIELVLRFCYFTDHPVEYSWVTKHEDIREFGFSSLMEYIGRNEALSGLTRKSEILSLVSSHYADCSRYVHVHSEMYLYTGLDQANSPSDVTMRDVSRCLETLVPCLILLIFATKPRAFFECTAGEQYLIRYYVGKQWKQELEEIISTGC